MARDHDPIEGPCGHGGYRNRLTHFYDEVDTAELFDICAHHADDIRRVRDAMLDWLRRHPELVDGAL